MTIPFILLQSVFVPLLAILAVALFGPRLGKKTGWIAVASLVYTTSLLLISGLDILRKGSPILEEYSWTTFPSLTIKVGFFADGLSLPVALVVSIVTLVCALYSIPYLEHRIEELYDEGRNGLYTVYYASFLFFAIGLVGVSLSTNLVALFIFLELLLIPPYMLIGLFGYGKKKRIAMIYFVWNHVGAAFFLIGIVLVVIYTGSFEVNAISSLAGTPIAFWVVFFMIIGWLVKMATFGFHIWLPHAHGNTPTAIAPIIAAIVGLGNYVLVRLLVGQLFDVFQIFSMPLMVLALITMIYGGMLTIAQDDIKNLYACSTIGQTAYSLLGIASLSLFGLAGGIFYFLSHILGKGILFHVAGIVVTQTGTRNIKKMGGLVSKMPMTTILCASGSLLLAALPPLSGFQAKWIMFGGIFTDAAGSTPKLIIAIAAIFAAFLTPMYTIWPLRRIFFGKLPDSLQHVKEAPLSMTAPLLIFVITSLVLGLYPDLVMDFLTSYISTLPW